MYVCMYVCTYICVARSADKIVTSGVRSVDEVFTDFTLLFRLHSTTFGDEF